jgi:hypothetical protein
MIKQILEKKMLEMAAVQHKNEDNVLSLQNVVGVSLGNRIKKDRETDEPVISVLVNHKVDRGLLDESQIIPQKLDDIPTDVVEVGDIFAGDNQPTPTGLVGTGNETLETANTDFSPSLKKRIRPARGGFSVGHYQITAGTIGTCCYDLSPFPGMPGKYYILSNNHVLANSNEARIGDPILQPGPYDGGRLAADVIARLTRFVPIRFISGKDEPVNYVDAATAEGSLADLDRAVYWIGSVKRLYEAPKIGDIVQKTGRTTGFTTGKVTNINGTVYVNYSGGKVARFTQQIITTAMSAGGDSGSLVTNLDEGAVGLLFAGSSTTTIVNNIAWVQALLKVRVTEK